MVKADTGTKLDQYGAKVGLAYSYWSLGKEFLPTVIEKIEEAKKVATEYLSQDSIGEEESVRLQFSLANNLCYYYLEQWIDTPETSRVNDIHSRRQRAEQEFQTLRKLAEMHSQSASANVYDTLAWFCFQSAQQTKDISKSSDLINRAREYIASCEGAINKAPSRLTSTSIQREHIQTIMSKCLR
jgi:hypothetical protein